MSLIKNINLSLVLVQPRKTRLLMGCKRIKSNKQNNICLKSLIKHTYTVKTCLKRPPKIDKTKVLKTNGSLMKVKSIAECSPWSILQYF